MPILASKQAALSNKLQSFVRATVRQELESLLSDPEFSLALQPAIKRRLSLGRKARSSELVSAAAVFKRLGLSA